MLTVIKLHGVLGKKFGREWKLDVETPREAIHAIDTLRPGFGRFLIELNKQALGYRVLVGKRAIKKDTAPDELAMLNGGKTLSIIPVFQGTANSKAIGEIILGVVLVIAGLVIGFSSLGFGSPFAVPLILEGAALIIGGAASLLMGSPKLASSSGNKTKPSYNFSGPINTIAQGEAYPVCYGDMWCGSAVISAGVSAEDIKYSNNPASRSGGLSGTGGGAGGVIAKHRDTSAPLGDPP